MAEHLTALAAAFTAFPKKIWRQITVQQPRTPQPREVRRRTDVVDIFPDRASITSASSEPSSPNNGKWIEGRRYLSGPHTQKAKAALTSTEEPAKQQTTNAALTT